jgi:hypothetical protein
VLDWISRNMFTPEGALEGISPQGHYGERYGSYPLACLLVGAVLLQRLDLVYPGIRCLLTWQDPASGGLWNTRQGRTASGEQDLFPTCQAGMTFLLAGQIEAARRAGGWLRKLWALQPDPEHVLYHVYSPAQGLVTDVRPDQQAVYTTRKDDPWQYHYNGGIAAAFLAQLCLATGEEQWLDLARRYQEVSMTTDECQFQSMQVCKSGWGSGLLYLVTREPRYRDWTVRLGEWFLAQQYEDGHWENTRHWVPIPDAAINIEITAEFVMHLANLISYLSV